ncbi:MAG: SiaC family regulatory phosphoprotein [Bacteroidales bacterium]
MTSRKNSLGSEINFDLHHAEVHLPPTKKTPEIYFHKEKGILKISGRSMPNRTNDFYFPVLRHIEEYIKNPPETTYVTLNLEYVDSASSKLLLSLLLRLKKILPQKILDIEWHYSADDYDMYELGLTYSEITGCNFEFVENN